MSPASQQDNAEDRPPRLPGHGWVIRVASVVIAAGLAVPLAALWLGARDRDLLQLLIFMLLSGCGSLVLGWGVAWGTTRRQVSLRLALAVICALGPICALANVAFTARLMFLSTHDLLLLTLLIVFALVPSIAAASLLGGRVAATIAGLGAGAARMARGDLATRVQGDGVIELHRLAEAFNTMAGQLEAAAQERVETEQ